MQNFFSGPQILEEVIYMQITPFSGIYFVMFLLLIISKYYFKLGHSLDTVLVAANASFQPSLEALTFTAPLCFQIGMNVKKFPISAAMGNVLTLLEVSTAFVIMDSKPMMTGQCV